MKKYLLTALLLLVFLPGLLKAESLNGVEPGTPYAMMLSQLGPDSMEELVKERKYVYYQEIFGPNSLVLVEFNPFSQDVTSIMAQYTNGQIATEKGVRVYDLQGKVTANYGQPIRSEKTELNDADAYYYFYQVKSRSGATQNLYFIFDQKTDTVLGIILESPDDSLEAHKGE